jgi:hypothetical protein
MILPIFTYFKHNFQNFYIYLIIHTREKFVNKHFWKNYVNRCVFSSDRLEEDKRYLNYLIGHTKVRITHLVTAETTPELISQYLDFQKLTGCQFTIKELIGYDDNGAYQKIRKEYPDIYHLDSGDYNIYYMPDNSIRKSFLT